MKACKVIALDAGIELIKNILAELLNYLLLASLAYVLIIDFFRMEADVKALMFTALVPLYYYFSRQVGKKAIIFFIMHALPTLGYIFFYEGNVAQKGTLIFISLLLMTFSISRRISEYHWGMEATLPPAAAGTYLVLHLIDAGQNGTCSVFILRSTIIFMTGYLLFFFLKQFLHYMDVNNRTTDHIPMNNVFYSAMGLATGFTILGSTIVILTSDRELMEKVGTVIQRAIIGFLTFLFSLFPERYIPKIIKNNPLPNDVSLQDLFGPPKDPSWLVILIDYLLRIFGIVVTMLLLYGLVVSAIKLIRAAFARKEVLETAVDDEHTDKVENLKRGQSGKENKERMSVWKQMQTAFTPAQKIRRLYRRTMEDNVHSWDKEDKEILLRQGTARECIGAFFAQSSQPALEFAQLYEKARYGADKCTPQDYRVAKELSERLR